MEQQLVREILTVTTKSVTEADKAVGARFTQVSMLALDQAESYLLYGTETERLAITKSFLTAISRLAATDTDDKLEAHRTTFLRTLSSMSDDITPHLTNAETEAITVGTHDQDDD